MSHINEVGPQQASLYQARGCGHEAKLAVADRLVEVILSVCMREYMDPDIVKLAAEYKGTAK
jgi:hypothetical protein